MIPKRIRRTITVNGDEYEYCVTGNTTDRKIYIKNLKTNEKISWYRENYDDGIGTKDIRALIETKELAGVKAR